MCVFEYIGNMMTQQVFENIFSEAQNKSDGAADLDRLRGFFF